MQDRYMGDIGDFGKYGLLRALCGGDLSLGVVWYLFRDEEATNDGDDIGYLAPLDGLEPSNANERRFRRCDPQLYDALRGAVEHGTRSVQAVRERGVLPTGAAFHEAPLSFENLPWTGPEAGLRRLERRKAWAWDALVATRGRDVVFADPDNGLESGTPRHHLRGPKFAYYDELIPYLDRNQSLVIYHHLGRNTSAENQIRDRLVQVNKLLGQALALRYRRGPARVFFVVPSDAHRDILTERAKRFVWDSCWGEHFTLVESRQ